MKRKLTISTLLLGALFLTLAPIALGTTWYVNGVSGSDKNHCISPQTAFCKTIGHAISLASSNDTVRVTPATYRENLTIGFSLKIIGTAANTTIIDGGADVITISSANAHVTLSQLTIANGERGVSNVGALTIINCTITGNHAVVFSGGGISNAGILTILNTTLNGNSAARGGGIFNSNGATLILINNTVSGNRAGSDFVRGAGGGIDNVDGTVTISSTISGNSSVFCIPFPPFPRCGDSYGGGIASSGSVKIQNSIVANNTSGGNCYSTGTMTSKGYNMSSDGRCNFFSKGDWNNTDPMLGPLQNNRGPTWTMALQPGSPAIDAGNPLGCTDGQGHLLMTDQRGQPRPDKEDKTGCDIGAYERQSD